MAEFYDLLLMLLQIAEEKNLLQLTLGSGDVIKYVQHDAKHEVEGIGDHTDLVPGVYEGEGRRHPLLRDKIVIRP